MTSKPLRAGVLVLAITLAVAPTASVAVAPLLMMMIKQIAQQAATSMLKDTLLSGLSGMGCKGMALSNALAALDLRGGAGGMAGALLGGMPMPGGMPTLPTGITMPDLPPGMGLPDMPGGAGMALGGLPSGAGIPADIAAKLGTMMPNAGQLPAGMALDPDQMAMLADLQQAMSEPLSSPETVATIDELFALGLLPQPIQAELKECMVLVPATIPVLGQGMGMIKPMIPQFRQARDELQALSPAEQDEVADMLTQEIESLPPDQVEAFMETLDSGFFPPRVREGVKTRLR